jgi:hypothetical protein
VRLLMRLLRLLMRLLRLLMGLLRPLSERRLHPDHRLGIEFRQALGDSGGNNRVLPQYRRQDGCWDFPLLHHDTSFLL